MSDLNTAERRADDFIERRQRDASDIGSVEYRTSGVKQPVTATAVAPGQFALFTCLGLLIVLLLMSAA